MKNMVDIINKLGAEQSPLFEQFLNWFFEGKTSTKVLEEITNGNYCDEFKANVLVILLGE